MTERLPSLKPREVVRALKRAGFVISRTSGSHCRLIHLRDPARKVIVPTHSGDLKRGTAAFGRTGLWAASPPGAASPVDGRPWGRFNVRSWADSHGNLTPGPTEPCARSGRRGTSRLVKRAGSLVPQNEFREGAARKTGRAALLILKDEEVIANDCGQEGSQFRRGHREPPSLSVSLNCLTNSLAVLILIPLGVLPLRGTICLRPALLEA
jgi:predicted RNA binding protein YcfA (HicA-like mRNA interferase family)